MKEPFICEYCGHEFYAREDVDRQCCSVDCAMSIRHINRCQNKVTMMPVDVYLNQNNPEENYDNDEVNALATGMSIEEYDDVYGVDDGLSITTPRGDVYHEMNKHADELIVLYECPHKTTYTKHRHHPDYDKPLQIELLCRRCHFARHKDQIKEAFCFDFTERSIAYQAKIGNTPKTLTLGGLGKGNSELHSSCSPPEVMNQVMSA